MKKLIYIIKSNNLVNYLRKVYKRIRYFLRYRKNQTIVDEPYSSHLPILLFLIKKNKLKHVLEVGSGYYSTKFLGLILGSMKSKLISIEDDVNWFKNLSEDYNNNSNVDLIYSLNPSLDILRRNNPNYDLIFIDNGKKPEDRIRIIETALKLSFRYIVIHDVQEPIYNQFIKSILRDDLAFIEIDTLYPHTGVIFSSTDQDNIYNLTKFIRQNKSTSVIDYDAWIILVDSFE